MLSLNAEITATSYSVEIPEDTFLRLLKSEGFSTGTVQTHEQLDVKLMNAGAYDIEYNGHYGPHVFFTLSAEDDCPNMRVELCTLIAEHLVALSP